MVSDLGSELKVPGSRLAMEYLKKKNPLGY